MISSASKNPKNGDSTGGSGGSDASRKPLLVSAAVILRESNSASSPQSLSSLGSGRAEVGEATSSNPQGFEVLIARRRLDAKSEAGKWEFPGGKVEFGETPEASLRREIKEELGLSIEVGWLLTVVSHVYHAETAQAVHVVLLCYLCRLAAEDASGRFVLHDAADARWLSMASIDALAKTDRCEEFEISDFAAADHPVIRRGREIFDAAAYLRADHPDDLTRQGDTQKKLRE